MKVNNIKKKIVLFLVLGMVGLFPSCEKWLDVSPRTEMKLEDLFNSESGYSDVLTGVYAYMAKSEMYGRELSYGFLDVLAQYYDTPRLNSGSYGHSYNKESLYKYGEKDPEARIKEIWSGMYGRIVNLNLGIEYINKNEALFNDKNIYHIYRGEYYGLRAMLHFDLLRMFAPAPLANGGSGMNAKAIPYIVTYTKQPQPQLTVNEVLDKVIADLIIAKEALIKGDPYGPLSLTRPKEEDLEERLKSRSTRLNYYAASALLARVYLYAGKKDLALAEAKAIIGEPEGEPKFFTLAVANATDAAPLFAKEEMFSLTIADFNKQMEGFLTETTGGNSMLTMNTNMQVAFYSLNAGDSDFRANWLKPNKNSNFMLRKYVSADRVSLITVSELYLIAAECASPEEGLRYLNKIYHNRGRVALKPTADIALNIYQEYRREMIGNGQMFFYYKRNQFSKVGLLDNIIIKDLAAVYNLPFPKTELEFGNVAK